MNFKRDIHISGMSSWDPNPAKGVRVPFSNLNFGSQCLGQDIPFVVCKMQQLEERRLAGPNCKRGSMYNVHPCLILHTLLKHGLEPKKSAHKFSRSVGQYVTPLSAGSSDLTRRFDQDGSTGLPAYGYDVVVPWLPTRHENHETRGYEERLYCNDCQRSADVRTRGGTPKIPAC